MPRKPPQMVSPQEFARHIGVSAARVHKAMQDKVLKNAVKNIRSSTGGNRYKIDLKKGLAEWEENIEPGRRLVQARFHGKEIVTPGIMDAAAELDAETADPDDQEKKPKKLKGAIGGFSDARARNEDYKARLSKLEYHERAGELVPVADVQRAAFRVARLVREAMLALPLKMAHELTAMTDRHDIEVYLRKNITDALRDLKDVERISAAD